MRWPEPSRTEWIGIAVMSATVVALIAPTPHWQISYSESCNLCGCRRHTQEVYRWWQLDSKSSRFEPTAPPPVNHEHNWWEYSRACNSWSTKYAADKTRYQNRAEQWISPEERQ